MNIKEEVMDSGSEEETPIVQHDIDGSQNASLTAIVAEATDESTPMVQDEADTSNGNVEAEISRFLKKKRFPTDPNGIRRQRAKIIRKISSLLNILNSAIGDEAVLVVTSPSNVSDFKCIGSKSLKGIINSIAPQIVEELSYRKPSHDTKPKDEGLYELPELLVDGKPVQLESMTQAQLRQFIPLMLKYSTGRGKPGWGKEATRPVWWPQDIPWENVRLDNRNEDEKRSTPWRTALQSIIRCCYTYHGREDLLDCVNKEESELYFVQQEEEEAEDSVRILSGVDDSVGDGSDDINEQKPQLAVAVSEATVDTITGEVTYPFPGYHNNVKFKILDGNGVELEICNGPQDLMTSEDGEVHLVPVEVNDSFVQFM